MKQTREWIKKKRTKMIRISEENHKILTNDCIKEFLRNYPNADIHDITIDFILSRVCTFFLEKINTKKGLDLMIGLFPPPELQKEVKPLSIERIKERKIYYHNFSIKEIVNLFVNSKGICNNCDRFVGVDGLTVDHIIPVSKVKQRHIYNIDGIQLLCRRCNSLKGDKY